MIYSGAEACCQTNVDLAWNIPVTRRHSSFLMGASRAFAQISAVLAPTVSGFLLSQDPEFGWRNVFSLSFVINTLGLIFYLIFGKADVQDWAKERKLTHLWSYPTLDGKSLGTLFHKWEGFSGGQTEKIFLAVALFKSEIISLFYSDLFLRKISDEWKSK